MMLMEDLVYSIKKHGIDYFVFINGHAGNRDCLKILCTKLRHNKGIKTASMFYFDLARDVIKSHLKNRTWGHADEIEASMAIYLGREDLIKKDTMTAGEMTDIFLPHISTSGEPGIYFPLVFEEKTVNGAQSDAAKGSYATGKMICDAVVERMVRFAREFVKIK